MGSDPYTPYQQYGQPVSVAYSYKMFCLLPYIDFYWIDDTCIKDRYMTIGWLFWSFDISLIRKDEHDV